MRELLAHLPNERVLLGRPGLKTDVDDNVANHKTPRGNETEKFVKLANIIRNLASPVLLTTTNYGFLDLVLNLLHSIERLSMQLTILVICEDKTAYVELLKRQSNFSVKFHLTLTHLQESVAKAVDYKSQPYISIVQKRVSYVELLLQRGLDVFFVDSDVVLLENPLEYFIDDKYDVFVQSDTANKDNLCAGFFYLRANDKTERFVRTWRHDLVKDPRGSQFTFNRQLRMFRPKMKVKVLPMDRFMSGQVFLKLEKPWFESSPLPVEVHANFMIGRGEKADMLKKHELWFVKD
ncbi:UDP-D-xylose:L-fucose alpha-1,3-D-xylosyltransferase 3 [Holothuria leucospilota]|uniref:UDP-D-xylose:L-fucose alpha-1,3-D-xylosyltransferase 3 n=1 Tax=Holothuria leucospilota TaxID=206669 RepID=A0A9Q1CKY2_HOLLE|nr:UDP-D-xylose:L-fucose alpha-1,3-D-xylosyltransferase 3 [Holothuria leucospilota]